MKSEQEIKEAIEAAQQREEGLAYNENGAVGSIQKIAMMCDSQVEALQWVLDQDDGFIYGLKSYKSRNND